MSHYLDKMWTFLVFLALASIAISSPLQQVVNSTIIVRTEGGLIQGKIATSIWNRTYSSFMAIPYAQPPIGDLRFKSPKPVKPWAGVRKAIDEGPYCPQSVMNFTEAKMSEDCLYLNVYVPQVVPLVAPAKSLSVLVWIHGGGGISGSGIRDMYGPDNLMNMTAILVTLNYRMNALGCMSMEHPDMTSNAGLKDQVAALRWVKRNIANFGGNPEDVTIFGESTGGINVELLLLSPMTEGLFHRAISQSGSAMAIGSNPSYNGTRAAFRLGEILGYNTSNADDLVKFLRSVSAEDLLNAQTVSTAEADGFTTLPGVDVKVQEGSEVFLTDVPEKLIRAGKSHPVPFIIGANSKELKTIETGLTQAVMDSYNNNPEQLIPSSLNITKNTAEYKALGEKIKQFYFGNKNISFDTLNELVDLLSDNFKMYSVHRSAMLYINYGSSPVYRYLFTYDGTLRNQVGNYTVKGPAHADDCAYLFYLSYVPYNPNANDITVIKHFTNLWVGFAETGDPSVYESVKWTAATKTNHTYLDLGLELKLGQDMLKERMAFWDEVYETYNK